MTIMLFLLFLVFPRRNGRIFALILSRISSKSNRTGKSVLISRVHQASPFARFSVLF